MQSSSIQSDQSQFPVQNTKSTISYPKKTLVISAIGVGILFGAAVTLSTALVFGGVVLPITAGIGIALVAATGFIFIVSIDKLNYRTYNGLVGEWHVLGTSQVEQKAVNGCTSIALFTLDQILANPNKFLNSGFLNKCIINGSAAHLRQYGRSPINQFVRKVVEDLELKNLNQVEELTYDPQMAILMPESPQTREQLTARMIESANGKSFGATITDGRETIALYYKNEHEIYVIDSHKKTFNPDSQDRVDLENAYIVKFDSKASVDHFLFKQRYFFDSQAMDDMLNDHEGQLGDQVANQIDITVFQKSASK